MRTVLMISRNKDNKNIPNFEQRKRSYIMSDEQLFNELENKFKDFVEKGVNGELSRCYVSVNYRDKEITKKKLIVELLMNPFDLSRINAVTCGIANKPECARTHYWLFDFDSEDKETLVKFINDISKQTGEEIDDIILYIKQTINGYSVAVKHGFDTRKLINDYPFVELKRDDMFLHMYGRKGGFVENTKDFAFYPSTHVEFTKNFMISTYTDELLEF